MSYNIIVDLSHNERIDELYLLDEDEFEIEFIDKNEGPIEFDLLEDYDILFMGDIQHRKNNLEDKFTKEELLAIKKFIGEGGGLFLTTGVGGDRDFQMKLGSIRVLYKMTGVKRFWNGYIQEAPSHFLVNKQNILITELFNHPITEGISEVVLPNCTFFTITEEDVEDIIVTSEKAEFSYLMDNEIGAVGTVPVCVVSEFFNGRCVTIGSSDWLLENDFGLDAGDNLRFLENCIRWLSFDL